MATSYDIAILGATPAGFAAAYRLATKKFRVVVVDSPRQSAECPLADWAPVELFRLGSLPRSLAKQSKAEPFQRVRYHSASLGRSVDHASRKQEGHFLRTGDFVAALRKAAQQAGATVTRARRRPPIELKEDETVVGLSRKLRAKLLLVAQDRPEEALRELSLTSRMVSSGSLVTAGLDVPLRRKEHHKDLGGILHVVELSERSELGMFFAVDSVLHLRVISTSSAAGMRAAELSEMVSGLQDRKVLPDDLPLAQATGAVWYPPAGAALEMETHVAKRCLLIGTAGGFADTITGHSLYPSVRSGLLAADAAGDALGARDVQDRLDAFKNSWRKELADYLRPPNTALQMLLPLLFVNPRIVPRFTGALLAGRPI